MTLGWKDVLTRIGLVCLLFLCIPINIKKPKEYEKRLLFKSYVSKHNKSYKEGSQEYEERFKYFEESMAKIEKLNSARQNDDSAIYGLTEFSDLSLKEFKDKHLAKHHHNVKHQHHHVSAMFSEESNHILKRAIKELPSKVDWRTKGVVTAVRNQRLCGACWAFSTIETVESMLAIKNGTLLDLSVQEIIDCARNGNLGCDGGDTCGLLEWLTENKIKIEVEKNYPLHLQTELCKLKKNGEGIQVSPYFSCDYLVGNEAKLMKLLANHGPVAVAVNALTWQYYISGVISSDCSGSPFDINHAVQIVGYDKTAPTPHYIVRNSWGTGYGDKGYLYIALGNNMCGIATEVASLDVL